MKAVVVDSPADILSPTLCNGSNEPSIVFSRPISFVGFSEDLFTDMLRILICGDGHGVSLRVILDGKCFSDVPAPLLCRSFSLISRITSSLKEKVRNMVSKASVTREYKFESQPSFINSEIFSTRYEEGLCCIQYYLA